MRYEKITDIAPKFIVGSTATQPILETPGEVIQLCYSCSSLNVVSAS
jgi:hypothetical protein